MEVSEPIAIYKRLLLVFVFLTISFHMSSLYAYQLACCARCFRPVFTITGGYFATCKLGESKTFPIANPIVDSFYIYTPNKGTKYTSFVEAFFGYEWVIVPDSWAVQLGLAYNQTSELKISGNLTQDGDVASESSFTYRYNITFKQLLVEAKVLTMYWCRYHPYFIGAIGAGFDRATSFSTSVPPFLTFTRMYDGKTTKNFAFFVGVGLDFDLDDALRVGLGYRFTDFGKTSLGNASIDGTPVPGTLSQSNLYANALFLQITGLFNW